MIIARLFQWHNVCFGPPKSQWAGYLNSLINCHVIWAHRWSVSSYKCIVAVIQFLPTCWSSESVMAPLSQMFADYWHFQVGWRSQMIPGRVSSLNKWQMIRCCSNNAFCLAQTHRWTLNALKKDNRYKGIQGKIVYMHEKLLFLSKINPNYYASHNKCEFQCSPVQLHKAF